MSAPCYDVDDIRELLTSAEWARLGRFPWAVYDARTLSTVARFPSRAAAQDVARRLSLGRRA